MSRYTLWRFRAGKRAWYPMIGPTEFPQAVAHFAYGDQVTRWFLEGVRPRPKLGRFLVAQRGYALDFGQVVGG